MLLANLALVLFAGDVGFADLIDVDVGVSGTWRYLRNRWGLVEGTFRNRSDEDREIVVSVIPKGWESLQFSRRLVVPAGSMRQSRWPLLVPDVSPKQFDFEYIIETPTRYRLSPQAKLKGEFSVVNPESRTRSSFGYTGILQSGGEPDDVILCIESLCDQLRRKASTDPMRLNVNAKLMSSYPEAFETLEQLCVTASNLHQLPQLCEAITLWTQRGGRTWIFLDQTGIASARAVTGGQLQMSVVDRTSSLSVRYRRESVGAKVETFSREFPEPVPQVRVVSDCGNTWWTANDWPAVIHLPCGRGEYIVTTLSPKALVEPDESHRALPCTSQIVDRMFRVLPPELLIPEKKLTEFAADTIGYKVPSRTLAGSVLLTFTAMLLVAGFLLLHRDRAGVLLLAVPASAMICAAPAVLMGSRSRNVVPETVVSQQVADVVSGPSKQAASGVVSVYQPEPGPVSVSTTGYSLVVPLQPLAGSRPSRLTWTDAGTSEWSNLTQNAGISDYEYRAVDRVSQPSALNATLSVSGLTFLVGEEERANIHDAIVAGVMPDRMEVTRDSENRLLVRPGDVFDRHEYVTGAMLGDDQKFHREAYAALFEPEEIGEAKFPQELKLLYWSGSSESSVQIGKAPVIRSSHLVVRAVRILPPGEGDEFTIPEILLPLRNVISRNGGVGGAYNNRNKEWLEQSRAADSMFEFTIPEGCRPFDALGGTLTIAVRAGARNVQISAGTRDRLEPVQLLESPAGLFEIDLAGHLECLVEQGSILIEVSVGEPELAEKTQHMSRDDSWMVERLTMTLRGRRDSSKRK